MSRYASSERLRLGLSLSPLPASPDIAASSHSSACGPPLPGGPMIGTSVGQFQFRQGTDFRGIGDPLALSVESRRREAAVRDPYFAQSGLEAAIVPIFEMHL